jgi:hypothetical protein
MIALFRFETMTVSDRIQVRVWWVQYNVMRIPVVPTLLYYTGSPIPIIGLQDGVFCTRSRNDPNSIRRQKN